MFEDAAAVGPAATLPAAGQAAEQPSARVVESWAEALAGLARSAAPPAPLSDVERVDLVGALEVLKSAAAAAQARLSADLDASVRARHAAAGLPADQHGRGVGAQVALARQDSPARGGQHLGLARALVHEMPHTLGALAQGRLSEWRATLLVRETACLSREDRARVDAELVADPARLAGLGDRRVAYRLDPAAALRRASTAAQDRRVTCRPAPDTMTYLGALLPVRHGVAAYAALSQAADQARAAGDPRTRGQLMADTLVARVTGRSTATGPDIALQLVMTDRALLAGDHEPAQVPGYGPVPAPLAREWLHPTRHGDADSADGGADSADGGADAEQAAVWVRRLFTHPSTGQLVAMDSRPGLPATAARPARHPRRGLPDTVVRRAGPAR